MNRWKDIPGYPNYQANRVGMIRRIYPNGSIKVISPYCKKNSNNKHMVVKLLDGGKRREKTLIGLIATTFLGPPPNGYVPYHKNGVQSDNYIGNIEYIPRTELGKITGAKAKRRPVVKIDSSGNIVDFYSSGREAARKNFYSYQTIIDRCNGKCKGLFADDGYAYVWDEDKDIKKTIWEIKKMTNGK